MQTVRFEAHHRVALTSLGLTSRVIDYIEADALPTAHRFLRPQPPRGDVHGELCDLRKTLCRARAEIERLLGATRNVPHLKAALAQISGGCGRYSLGGLRLNETSQSLAVAIGVLDKGMAELPPGPVRHRFADPYPIELIHNALNAGFFAATGDLYAHGIHPSRSPTSAFRRLVGICYEAMGAPGADPERALKAYVKAWRDMERRFEELRHEGQNPPEEPDVPS